MAVKLITYDLNSPGQNHKAVLEKIKTYAWARLSESSYAVDSTDTASGLYQKFKPLLDRNDTFLVIPLSKPFAGRATQDVLDWLNARL